MRCIHCLEDKTRVVRTRSLTPPREEVRWDDEYDDVHVHDEYVFRERVCEVCATRFTTIEVPSPSKVYVVKHGGAREPFDPYKLYHSIKIAYRPELGSKQKDVFIEVLRKLALNNQDVEEIDSFKIGEAVLDELRKVSRVAWLRYSAYHHDQKHHERVVMEQFIEEEIIKRGVNFSPNAEEA
jgi:transcriptional repressor NrdR